MTRAIGSTLVVVGFLVWVFGLGVQMAQRDWPALKDRAVWVPEKTERHVGVQAVRPPRDDWAPPRHRNESYGWHTGVSVFPSHAAFSTDCLMAENGMFYTICKSQP